jgi:hypothetical protein
MVCEPGIECPPGHHPEEICSGEEGEPPHCEMICVPEAPPEPE